jgi:hypothetical protein
MVTVPEPEEPTPTTAQLALKRGESIARNVVAGSPVGAVRRLVLYVVVAVALILAPAPVAVVGLIGVLLLIGTDQIV